MRRKGFEKINLKIISMIAILIFFFTIGIGYSQLRQKMNIYGKASIVEQKVNGYIKGNSIYNYQIVNVEKNDDFTIYDVKLDVTNLDNDINSWKIEFDVPNGYIDLESSTEQNMKKVYENGRLKISSDSYISKGSNLGIKVELVFSGEGQFEISNLTLNDKLASNT